MLCTHHACRCDRANELALMAARTGNVALLAQAVAVHSERVECRLVAPMTAQQSEGEWATSLT